METFLRKNRNKERVPLLRESRWGLEQQLGVAGAALLLVDRARCQRLPDQWAWFPYGLEFGFLLRVRTLEAARA